MIKIMMTVRNRLEMTKKTIEALEKHTKGKYELYIYNNLTDHKLDSHVVYFNKLYKEGRVAQVVYNSKKSTFSAFSKAVSIVQFGTQHLFDPRKDEYDYLVIMDNDIVVMPGWDKVFKKVWKEIKAKGLNTKHKVVTQYPGGIIDPRPEIPQGPQKLGGMPYRNLGGFETSVGVCGGSGFWTMLPDFFNDVGFLPIAPLVGKDNADDQVYWGLMQQKSGDRQYIVGVKEEMAFHCGGDFGSVCNILREQHRGKERFDQIQFEDSEDRYLTMSFDEFYQMCLEHPEWRKW